MADGDPEERLAKRRWSILQLVRILAALTVMLGLVVVSGRLIDVPAIGYTLLVLGAFAFFALPVMLAKRWKSGR